ncbi:IclR family transcriptional regulator [Advenella kashmirensis W13003]|uniref:IclR family transcriptional regulator n=1 Tax=Advenella kashmirensis W13003 TaxID=1424334 RepID=V8QVC3_9BURK|nr:IclR family transcriptional regulator [Advenella kashmirensis]ETF03308.1 IclR family transcriptional regulator [Advenella kashmirensis W13003]
MLSQSDKGGADRVLYILSVFAKIERPVTVAELITLTALPQSTLYRQLTLLKKWGFVFEVQGEYMPGPRCLPLAWGFNHSSFLLQHARKDMLALSTQTGESVGILVAVEDVAVCLDMVESTSSLRCSFVKGRSLPLIRGASAKSLLAFLPPAKQQAVVQQAIAQGLLNTAQAEQLKADVITVQQHGYAVSEGEVDDGVWGVSAPLFQHKNSALGVITLMAPTARASPRAQQLIHATVRAASSISSTLAALLD